MLRPAVPLAFRMLQLLTGAVLGLVLAWPAGAQQGLDVLPAEGMDSLERAYKQHRELLLNLFKGKTIADKDDKQHQEAIDFAAKWIVYRFTWLTNQVKEGEIDKIHKLFETDVKNIERYRPNTDSLAQMYGKQMVLRAGEVLQTRKAIARVNAARVLAGLAETGQPPELVDLLCQAIDDPAQNEGVKWFAVRGLGDMLGRAARSAEQDGPVLLTRERQDRALKTLLDFAQRKPALGPAPSREDIEGFRVLRREALRALGQARTPSVRTVGQPALVLLRNLARDGITPEPRLDERLESAIGLGWMRQAADPDFQPDYAAHFIGLFVDELAVAYQNRTKDETLPWKVCAARLVEALQNMKATSKNPYVPKVVDQCTVHLLDMERGAVLNPNVLNNLKPWLQMNPPPSTTLFKSIPDSRVNPAAAAETGGAVGGRE